MSESDAIQLRGKNETQIRLILEKRKECSGWFTQDIPNGALCQRNIPCLPSIH